MKPHCLKEASIRALLAAVLSCALAACGAKKDPSATQVAAKVNRQEISVHQVNHLLQRQGALAPERLDDASRKTLDTLIDQELLIQAAEAQHIDRDPAVMMAIEASRRDVIARAYAERLAEGAAAPAPEEVRAYYDSKPALFAQRRLYTLVETGFEATPQQQDALRPAVQSASDSASLLAALRSAGLRFGTRQVKAGPEALPLQAVDAVAALREGQSYLLTGPGEGRIYTVLAAQPAPLGLEEARPAIEQYLRVERRRQLVERLVKARRSAARIEYEGRFAPAAAKSAELHLIHDVPALRHFALNAAEPTGERLFR